MSNSVKPKKRIALKLLFLLLIFMAPLIAAIFVYQARDNLHFVSKNAGELIIPPVNISELGLEPLERRWWMTYYTPGDCDAACVETLKHFNTIHLSLVKNHDRLGELLITPENIVLIPENITYLKVDTLKQTLPASLLKPNQTTAIWLIDPNGNIILSYDPNELDNLMMLDLRHLLKVSQIG